MLATTTAGNTTNNPITYAASGSYPYGPSGPYNASGSAGVTKSFLNDVISVVMDHDLPCYGLLMRFRQFKDLRNWDNTTLDPVTMREILETGLYGTLWGIDIVVSRRVPAGTVYAITEPRFFGVMPIRTEFMLMPDDDPKQATIGYVGYEEIGMTIPNANGVAKGIVPDAGGFPTPDPYPYN